MNQTAARHATPVDMSPRYSHQATKSGRAVLKTDILRRPISPEPGFVNVHFGLRSQTARKGMLASRRPQPRRRAG